MGIGGTHIGSEMPLVHDYLHLFPCDELDVSLIIPWSNHENVIEPDDGRSPQYASILDGLKLFRIKEMLDHIEFGPCMDLACAHEKVGVIGHQTYRGEEKRNQHSICF